MFCFFCLGFLCLGFFCLGLFCLGLFMGSFAALQQALLQPAAGVLPLFVQVLEQ